MTIDQLLESKAFKALGAIVVTGLVYYAIEISIPVAYEIFSVNDKGFSALIRDGYPTGVGADPTRNRYGGFQNP